MDNQGTEQELKITICDCPFVEWCESGRQQLQEHFRKEDKKYRITDCDFYKIIKNREETEKEPFFKGYKHNFYLKD
jgi:hypothetical protein